jgi:hypothetical protein
MVRRLITGAAIVATLAVPSSALARSAPVGLYRCHRGQQCVYGPLHERFATYGNIYPSDLGDCTFAAAADWEQVKLGILPDTSRIPFDFGAARGGEDGLSVEALLTYWGESGGIEGYVLTGQSAFTVEREDVENGVYDYGALIAELELGSAGIGRDKTDRGTHVLVVDGFTPKGPLVVTWGETIQMTWKQWRAEAQEMWALTVA